MAIAGVLNLIFKANTTNASKGLQSLKKESSTTMSALQSLGGAARKAGEVVTKGLFSIGTGATALGGLSVAAAHNVRENQRWADSLGIPAKRLEALQRVGSKYGISAERMSDATKDLNERVADAVSGAPAMIEAFASMGLKAEDLINLRADEQLFKVAEAIQKMGSAGDQSFRAMELMADAGFDLLPLIRANGAEFANMTREAENSGTALGNVERGSLLALNNSFSSLTGTLGDISKQLLGKTAPVFQRVFDYISGNAGILLNNFIAVGQGIYDTFKGIAIGIHDVMGDILSFLGTDFKSIGKMFDDYISTPLQTTLGVIKKVGQTGDASLLFNPMEYALAQARVENARPSSGGIGERLGALSDKGGANFFNAIEIRLSGLLKSTDEGNAILDDLNKKDAVTGGKLGGATNKPTATTAGSLSAMQINPNQIKLGSIGDSISAKQLAAQQATARATDSIDRTLKALTRIDATTGQRYTFGTGGWS